MRLATLLALCSIQAFSQTNSDKPKVVYEEVTKNDPGLLPCHEFDSHIGKPIQPFDFVDLDGRRWKSSELSGKVIYLNIWFIGCPPCVQEMPSLNALFNEFGARGDVVMLSIASDSAEALKKFITTNPIKLPLASVPFQQVKQLAMVGGTIGFPTHLIIDREGKLALASRGGSTQIQKELRYSLNTVISQPVSAAK